ncbi:MAG TPA: hypothetical protein VHO84_03785 [Syntrophorhabdaceae bacterium]|nr:hypothetical protein [Syntrophorhabdaceae bacterium]
MDRSLTQKKSSETTSLTFNGRYELTILFIMVILLAISVFPLRSSAAPKQTDSGKALTIPSGSPAVSAPLSKFATTPPAKSSPPAGTGTSLAAELNITINKIFLKNNKIFIEMNGMDGRRMNPEDFVKMTLRLETVKGQRKWNLADIDKAKSLMNGGRFEFDTGIVLDKSEVVKALLSLGKIEKMKHEMLSISPVSSIMSTAPISAAKQVKKSG